VIGASSQAAGNRAASPLVVAGVALGGAGLALAATIGLAGLSLVGVGAAAVTILCLWLVASERYELTLAVLALYVGLLDGFLRLRTGVAELTLLRDLLLYSIVFGVLVRWAVRGDRLHLPPLTGWVLAFVAVVVVQVLNPANEDLFYSLAALRPHLEWVPLFFLGFAVMRSPARLKGLLALLVAMAAINGVVSIVQSQLTPAQLAAWGPGYEERISGLGDVSGRTFEDDTGVERVRPFALGSDIGFAGTLGFLALPGALVFAALAARRRWTLLLVLPMLAGIVGGVVTSQSRTAVVAAAVSVLAYLALTLLSVRSARALIGIAVGGVVGFWAISALVAESPPGLFDRYDDISPRLVASTTIEYRQRDLLLLPEYATRFPLGAGLGSGGPATSLLLERERGGYLSAEGQPNYLVIELGVPGLVVMTGFLILLLTRSVRRIHSLRERDSRLLIAGVAAPLFAQAATWIVGIATSSTPGGPYFWTAAGILAFWLYPAQEHYPGPAAGYGAKTELSPG
jgi:hypothetical protein